MADKDVETLQGPAAENDEDTEGNRRGTRIVIRNDDEDSEDTEGNRRGTRIVIRNDGEDDEDTEGNRRSL